MIFFLHKEASMSTTERYRKGDMVYPEGSFEMSMFHIIEGSVLIYAFYGKENEILLTEEGKGSYFGQLELIEAIPRSATVIAKEDLVVEKITGDEFGSYLESHQGEEMALLTQMSARLREIGNQLHVVYHTIDEYISDSHSGHDESFFNRLGRIIRFGKGVRK